MTSLLEQAPDWLTRREYNRAIRAASFAPFAPPHSRHSRRLIRAIRAAGLSFASLH